eukprot:TRINITY_DN6421_c0_g1_i1.p1 TRINITY_DN6421_c0_g1~~TRINITY_DN6421_c0_g1_i1.p1  ORF type:complete len:213 (-),score=54.10 TRINITY_DN6421_c0_g1_i1:59-697(-)
MDPVVTIYRVYITTLNMLNDRGYVVSKEEREKTIDEFREKFQSISDENVVRKDELTILAKSKLDPTDKILVFFFENPGDKQGISTETIRKYFDSCQTQGVCRAILISEAKLSPIAARLIEDFKKKKVIMEHFGESELIVNITQHELVPKHIPLKESEKQLVLEKYRIKESQFPRIKITDPIARYYGMQRGGVVKIVRHSETGGRYVTYRLVI